MSKIKSIDMMNLVELFFFCVAIILFSPHCVGALQLWTIKEDICGAGKTGIAINVTNREFYASFAGIFRLSDGSSIRPPAHERMESVRYMQELMYSVGVTVNDTLSAASTGKYEGDVLQICGSDVVDLLLLGIVGNFVTNPSDPQLSLQSGTSTASTVPSVVVDTFSGKLVMRMPYDAVRGYFIEALLVISIIVITRLSFVRNVTYKIVIPSSLSSSSMTQSTTTQLVPTPPAAQHLLQS